MCENGLKIAIENMFGSNPFTKAKEISVGGDAKELVALYDVLDDRLQGRDESGG